MKRKLLTTKTYRASGKRLSRGLAFEQMESRLALSATTGVETPGIQFQWSDSSAFLAAYQGGFISFNYNKQGDADQVLINSAGSLFQDTSHARAWLGNSRDELNLGSTSDFVISDGSLNSQPGSLSTIPQPTMGPMRPDGGMIAIGEIFAVAPLVKIGNDSEEVAQTMRGQFEHSEVASSEERLSLSRARDVYFEVAARVENTSFESPDRSIRTEAVVVSAQFDADEDLNQQSESESIK